MKGIQSRLATQTENIIISWIPSLNITYLLIIMSFLRRKLLDCIYAILEYNVILQYRLILELSILYSSITATSG